MKIYAANWKMNKTPNEARAFCQAFLKLNKNNKDELVIFPPALALEATQQSLQGSRVQWGLQNSYFKASGAYTGENSAEVLKSMGGQYVLIGHSERRQYFSEASLLLAEKVKYVLSLGLTPMLCIGETLEQRQSGQTIEVCKKQLVEALSLITPSQVTKTLSLVVAYEPVWAIGTGVVATPAQVRETHAALFAELKSMGYEKTPLLYGGSVKADNAKELGQIPHVDGFLVGGAALEAESFHRICESGSAQT